MCSVGGGEGWETLFYGIALKNLLSTFILRSVHALIFISFNEFNPISENIVCMNPKHFSQVFLSHSLKCHKMSINICILVRRYFWVLLRGFRHLHNLVFSCWSNSFRSTPSLSMQSKFHSDQQITFTSLHLLEYISWVTNTFRVYLKMGTFTLTQVHL